MAKSTEKPVKSKLLSAAKSKKSVATTDAKPQPPKSLALDSVLATSKKAGGKRKSAGIPPQDDEDRSLNRAKKLTQAAREAAAMPEKVEVVKERNQGKESRSRVAKADVVQSKSSKGKQREVESDDNDAMGEVKTPKTRKAQTSKPTVSAVSSNGKPRSVSTLSQPQKQTYPSSENEDEAESDEDKENGFEEREEHLFGFSTDDEDSSDDEVNDEPDPIEVSKLPTVAKDDAVVKQKLEKAKRKPAADRGVIYLGRVPHGFYEAQMKAYFSQFGEVTRLRLSRNKRTGRSKHYAFIEFDSSSVAQIVAETMDNYLLMGHILTCKMIPKDEVHPELWVGANRKWRAVPTARVARVKHNKSRTEEEQERAEKRLLKRQAQKKRKLEETGIKYDFEAVAYKKKSKASD